MRNSRLDESQAGIKIAGRSNNLRYADDTTLMAESKEEVKSLLMRLKEESERAGLKLNIQKSKIMASGPITSWHIHRETMETVTDFIFFGSRITEDSDYSHKIRRKAMTNLDSILKSSNITLLTKAHVVKAVVFQWSCTSMRAGPERRLSTEELWRQRGSWEPLGQQGEPTINPEGDHSWVFIGRTDAEAEAPILWPPEAKSWLIGKDPDAGKIEGGRRTGWQRMRSLDRIAASVNLS